MAVTLTRRLAAATPVPVFPVLGAGARRQVQLLRADDGIRLVASPRHATVLLVAGALPRELLGPALQVHDQLAAPRAVVRWGDDATWPGPHAHVAGTGDVVDSLRTAHRELVTGAREGAPPLLPAEHPVPWQGVGPYGHGGEGMMGGKPYGRPMPMPPQEGRDGLALDRLSLTLGPHLATFPPGLRLRVGLQGDVLEEVSLGDNPFATDRVTWDGEPLPDVVDADEPLVSGLLRFAELLALAGLDALARRATRLALDPSARDVEALRRRVVRTTALRWMTRGVGVTDVLGTTTDAERRWRSWLSGEAGVPDHATARQVLEALPELLLGCEIGAAMTTIATLPVDLEVAVADRGEVPA